MGRPSSEPQDRIAIVGGGISGLSTALLLSHNDIPCTLFESEPTLGGHALTVTPDLDDGTILPPMDIGFQVYNLTTYPNLVGMFNYLGVETEMSDMSLSFSLNTTTRSCPRHQNAEIKETERTGGLFEWSSRCVFPTLASLCDTQRVRLVWDVLRFAFQAPRDYRQTDVLVCEYVKAKRYSDVFVRAYLAPMVAAIWSVREGQALDMPLKSLITFMMNHHLLSTGWPPRPRWRVLKKRSAEYVARVRQKLKDVRVGNGIDQLVERGKERVVLQDSQGNVHAYKAVVFATHADTTLRILGGKASVDERKILGAIPYQPNRCVLHQDASYMPQERRLWASWNTFGTSSAVDDPLVCTYWLNNLQNFQSGTPDTFLTLNPNQEPRKKLGEWTLSHPILTKAGFKAQEKLHTIQGNDGVFFAGAWTEYGFHEDGMRSGIKVAQLLGAHHVPWETHTPSPVPPSVFAWAASAIVRYVCSRTIRRGSLRMILPDGTESTYGPSTPSHDTETSPSTCMRIYHLDAFSKMLTNGGTGIGEAYMEGSLDITSADVFAANMQALEAAKIYLGPAQAIKGQLSRWRHWYRARNTLSLAKENIRYHYDIGNDMYELFLDSYMQYSCAEFAGIHDTDIQAGQLRKMQSVLDQAGVKPGDKVLEIGCGWGGLGIFAVQRIGCTWTGVTLSTAQYEHSTSRIAALGLSDKIAILLRDFRELSEDQQYDAIVSIEMLEAVGHDNLGVFYKTVEKLLKPRGKACLQVIVMRNENYENYRKGSDFIRDYIFPGGHLPSLRAMEAAVTFQAPKLRLMRTRHLGKHYSTTLRCWRKVYTEKSHQLRRMGYPMKLQRMFRWYFMYCEAGFTNRLIDLVQLTYERQSSACPTGHSTHSAVFFGSLEHERLVGVKGRFRYPVAMTLVNLDEKRDMYWGPFVQFNEQDYGQRQRLPSLDGYIRDLVESHFGVRTDGQIRLLTTPRTLGYCFNPISVYFVSGASELEFVVLEVTNTPWLERHPYVLRPRRVPGTVHRYTAKFEKDLHVSPFFGMGYVYELDVRYDPHSLQQVDIRLRLLPRHQEGLEQPAFLAGLNLNKDGTPDPSFRSKLFLLFMPFLSQFWIHYEAATLLLKRQKLHKATHPEYESSSFGAGYRYSRDLLKHLAVFAVAGVVLLFMRVLGYDIGQSTKTGAQHRSTSQKPFQPMRDGQPLLSGRPS